MTEWQYRQGGISRASNSWTASAPLHSAPMETISPKLPHLLSNGSGAGPTWSYYLWEENFSSLTTSVLSRISRVQLPATLWTMACQAPLSMGFSRQEYRSGLLFSFSKSDMRQAKKTNKQPAELHKQANRNLPQKLRTIHTFDSTYSLALHSVSQWKLDVALYGMRCPPSLACEFMYLPCAGCPVLRISHNPRMRIPPHPYQ